MSTTVIVIIVVAVIVILLVAGIWALTRKRREHQRVEAQGIRTRAAEQELEVGQREARAEETAARSRAAKAEAEVKAAQAEQLAQRAHAHRGEAADSRTELDKEWERADKVDPDSKSREAQSGADPERPSPPRTGGVP
jgi:FtsZ-interacting cell division protein ZipA